MCKDTITFLTYGAASTRYMHIEGPPPLYMSYVSPEQTKQDQHQETLEATGGQLLKKKDNKMNESMQWKEVFRKNLLRMKSQCLLFNSFSDVVSYC